MTSDGPWPDALELAERIAADGAGSVRAVLLYGSRLQRTNPDPHSALDLVVLVDDYHVFYSGLARAGELHRPVRLMTALAKLLPPNVIAYPAAHAGEGRDAGDEGGRESGPGLAKCLVVDKRHLARALGPDPPDHFVLGRLVQEVGYVWAASAADEAWVRRQIAEAHGRVLRWMAPYLEGPVDAAGLGRRMMEILYQGELRPESKSRSDRVFEAQVEHFRSALAQTLESAAEEGTVERVDGEFVLAGPVPAAERRRWRRHFAVSKARTTLRWLKHMLTFANWLPYVRRKVERHTGRSIELTLPERKLPLIFLWPRAVWMLFTRPRREVDE